MSGAPLAWVFLGRAAYEPVWALQEALRDRVLAGDAAAETLLFVEHDPVITAGRSADLAHVLAPGLPVVRTSRGGDVTVHGPGQLVIYPVVRLARGVLAHVQEVGGALAAELGARGVAAELRRAPVGVFVRPAGSGPAWRAHERPGDRAREPSGLGAKIAACGLHVRRHVAIHGFALNVSAACLPSFQHIVPCGLAGVAVTALERELGEPPPPLAALAESLAARIALALGRTAERARDRFLA